MDHITTAQAAANWHCSPALVRRLAEQMRIGGAIKLGRDWLIPASAPRPNKRPPGRPKKILDT